MKPIYLEMQAFGPYVEKQVINFEDLKNSAKEKWDKVKEDAKSSWDTVKSNITDAIDGARSNVNEKIETIKGYFTDLVGKAFTWGKDLLQNFIDGIKSLWNSFTGTIGDLTGYIKSNLGFSEPEEGPLSNFHTFAPDMIDLWNEGIYENLGKVQESSQAMASTVATGVQPTDYSGALDGISGQLASMAGNGQPINVYIGSDRIGTAIARSNARAAYISGGH